jgi:soluble cytochrome b562
MSVPNVGTSDASSVWQQRRQDFNSLVSSIESGNIQDAQNSLSTLQQDSTPPSSNGPDQFTSTFSQIVGAVQSGNLTAAQQALSALQGGSATYGPQQAPAGVAGSTTSPSSGSTFQTDFQALIAAVKSGDTTAAQGALSKVQSDMKAQGHGHHHHHGGGSSTASATAPTTDTATDTTPVTT